MTKKQLISFPFLWLLFLGFANPTSSLAWSSEGHTAIVKLAFKLMPEKQRERIYGMLGTRDASVIGNWADKVKSKRPETGPWHFVDIPKDAHDYSASRDCKRGCVISEIDRLEQELKSSDLTDDARSEDLLFYIHLLSDLFQPFHDLGEASGATQIFVEFDGERTSLHSVWDYGIINQHILDAKTMRAMLKHAKSLQDEPIEQDVTKIALAEHDIAVENLVASETVLPAKYAEEKWPTVESGLVRAAVLLAERLKGL